MSEQFICEVVALIQAHEIFSDALEHEEESPICKCRLKKQSTQRIIIMRQIIRLRCQPYGKPCVCFHPLQEVPASAKSIHRFVLLFELVDDGRAEPPSLVGLSTKGNQILWHWTGKCMVCGGKKRRELYPKNC